LSLSRNAAYNIVGAVIPVVLSFVTVPLYLKLVGPERYGVLAIAWLLLGYFGLFDLGLGRATSFRIAALRDGRPDERADAFWAALAVNFGMGIVGGLVLWGASSYFFAHIFKVSEHMRSEVLAGAPLLAASVPVATMSGVLTGALQGREKFLQTNVVSVTSTALFQIFPLSIAWTIGPNVVLLLSGALAARVLAGVVLAWQCHAELTRGQPIRLKRSEVPTLLKYGGWVNLTSIFGPLLFIVDRFAIGAVLGAVAVTTYTVPFQLAQRIGILPGAVTNAMFPRMSAASPEERQALAEKSTRAMICLVTLPVLAGIFVIEPFLRIWVGDKIGAQGAPVGRIALIAFWLNAFALIPFVRLQSAGRPDIVSKFVIAELLPYLALLYFGLKFFGFEGCALAFAARCVSDYVFLTWLAGRSFPAWRTLFLSFCLLVLAADLASLWSITDWRWWVSAAATGAIAVAIGLHILPADFADQFMGGRFSGLLARLRPTGQSTLAPLADPLGMARARSSSRVRRANVIATPSDQA
jgi:O-antigen/teichoic acid export membrane protein